MDTLPFAEGGSRITGLLGALCWLWIIAAPLLLAHRLRKWLWGGRRVVAHGDSKKGKVLAALAAAEARASRKAADYERVKAAPADEKKPDDRYQRKNDDITRDPE